MIFRSVGALALALLLLPGCSTPVVKPEAEQIRITFDQEAVAGCTFLGQVVGSAGHWYNSWLINNDVLTIGALNDLRNRAQALGADMIYIPNHTMYFQTSVTITGQAYRCQKN